jgi:putative Mn2+ efflux pump MntP
VDLIAILFIALGLAMDAFAVSITSGFTTKQLKVNHAFRLAAFFGLFQAIMPVIGWLAGFGLRDFISGIDHWIAFGLLSIIGVKMILESTKMSPDKKIDPLNIYVLLMLSIATSIDALAVGLTLSVLNISIITPAIIIGIITFLLSFIGVFIGDRFGHFFENKIEALGGLILIGIGIKILIEHLA